MSLSDPERASAMLRIAKIRKREEDKKRKIRRRIIMCHRF
jgi:hypothetical protein